MPEEGQQDKGKPQSTIEKIATSPEQQAVAPTSEPSAASSPADPSSLTPSSASDPAGKTRSSRWLALAAVGALVVVAASGLWWHTHHAHQAGKAAKLTTIRVRLEWVNNPEFAGMYVAKEKGYYKAAGLNVKLEEFQDNTDVNKEVATGVVDYGVSTPLEVVLARDIGQKNKAIAAIYQTSAYSIVAQKKANINSPFDFKGKTLGAAGGNNEAKVTYAALLGKAGIPANQTTIKPVDFDILKVFKENQADTYDVYRTDQTYLLTKAHIPYTQVFPEQYGFSIYGDVLIASDAMIAKKPAQTAAFVKATLQGWQYALNHESETLTILAKYDNALYKDPAYVKYDLHGTLPLIRPTGDQPLGGMQYVPWNRAYIATKDAGLLHGSQDPSDLYTNEFVR